MKGTCFLFAILLLSPLAVLSQGRPSSPSADTARMLGADISFLPQLEARGEKFSVDGTQQDAIAILKEHGFNYIRLRIFVDPAAPKGYSPGKGFCDLRHTEEMARRIQKAHMGFLLDFHYSDTWADPSKQYKPAVWQHDDFAGLKRDIYRYTDSVISALKAQGTPPGIVQVGNEINHGMLWPDGRIDHPDTLAAFLRTAVSAVRAADPSIRIMLHIADGGQNAESRSFLDKMIARHVSFDLIGESYYPQWHGTLDDLRRNLTDLAGRYHQPIVVVEYSQHKKEVNDIVFGLPGHKGLGTFIWEPLNTWEALFDRQGGAKDSLLSIYPQVAAQYHIR